MITAVTRVLEMASLACNVAGCDRPSWVWLTVRQCEDLDS
jgi:hypothetical protein